MQQFDTVLELLHVYNMNTLRLLCGVSVCSHFAILLVYVISEFGSTVLCSLAREMRLTKPLLNVYTYWTA